MEAASRVLPDTAQVCRTTGAFDLNYPGYPGAIRYIYISIYASVVRCEGDSAGILGRQQFTLNLIKDMSCA